MNNKESSIDQFVAQLIKEKEITSVNDAVMEQIRQDLLDRIEDHINMSILEHMPAESLDEFNELIDKSSESQIQEFCVTRIDNFDEIIAQTLVDFRSVYLNL